jgi:hypothetical protein
MPWGGPLAADQHQPGTERRTVLEHAKMRPEEPGRFAAFLTIWNGSGQPRIIKTITVEGFSNVMLARTTTAGVAQTPIATSVIFIPANAELHMDVDTIFLLMNGKAGTPPKVTVTFDDGLVIQGTASFLNSGRGVTDHRHGR